MMIPSFIFYLFSTILIASAVMVVAARNPVHAVLFLILCFFNAAGLFVLLGAEFVAFILIIVYVGAVAVLFLFVVMMLDIGARERRRGFMKHVPVGLAVGGIICAQLALVAGAWTFDPHAVASATPNAVDNTRALGRVLYTDYVYVFEVAGLILLVAMIGAIVLTVRDRVPAKRQDAARQVSRRREDVIEIRKVKTGEGAS
jgi:NADH-quinone oxidoreductase subunit J